MSLPDHLFICNRLYSVTAQPMIEATGACDNAGQTITVDSTAHPQTQASVLVHEVFEALNASLNLDLPHPTISALESAWYGVLVQNHPWWEESI